MSTSNATRKQRVKRGLGLYASEGRNRSSGSNAGMTMVERNRRTAKAQKNAAKVAAATEKAAAKAHAAALKAEASAAKAAEKAAKEVAKAVEKAEKEAAKTEKALAAAAKKTVASEVRLATAASNRARCTSRRCDEAFVPEGAKIQRYTSKQCSRYCAPGSTNALCATCHGQVNNPKLWHGKVTNAGLPPYSHMRLEGVPHSNWNVATAAKEAKPKAAGKARSSSNTPAAAGGPASPAPGVPTFNFV